jgi:hypothetical protein
MPERDLGFTVTPMQSTRLKLLMGSLFVMTAASISCPALAQTTRTITTTDGSTYQGDLVESVVGDHVTIKLADGQVRRFAASEIREQILPSSDTPAPIVFPAITRAPVTYVGPDAVNVHLENDDGGGGTLFMESRSGWVPACTMPCTTSLDPKVQYKLHGSDPFGLPQKGNLDLVADYSKRRAFHTTGSWLLAPGVLALIAGPLTMGVGAGINAQDAMGPVAKQGGGQTAVDVGAVILGGGLLFTVLGAVFLAVHWSPTLTTRGGDTIVSKRASPIKLTPTGFVF